MMQSMGGTGTIAEGQPGRNMPRAGGAVNNLVNLSMADVQDMAELIEQEVLTPGLSDIYKVSSFIPDSQLMRIPGGKVMYHGSNKQSNVLRSKDIRGDYEFEWIGSLQFQDEAQRAERGMIFLNMIPTLAPMLQAQGYAFNVPELVHFAWRYMLGERGLNKIVVQLPKQAQQVGMPGAETANGQQQPGVNGTAQPTNGAAPKPLGGLNPTLPTPASRFMRGR